jgi:hypothetical protein
LKGIEFIRVGDESEQAENKLNITLCIIQCVHKNCTAFIASCVYTLEFATRIMMVFMEIAIDGQLGETKYESIV